MLLRVARNGLVVIGAVALVLLLLTVFVALDVDSDWPRDSAFLRLHAGRLELGWCRELYGLAQPLDLPTIYVDIHSPQPLSGLVPMFRHNDAPGFVTYHLIIPLWLPAFGCIAWPLTSFLLARRRRKGRGFAVEPTGDDAAPAIDPPRRRGDNILPP